MISLVSAQTAHIVELFLIIIHRLLYGTQRKSEFITSQLIAEPGQSPLLLRLSFYRSGYWLLMAVIDSHVSFINGFGFYCFGPDRGRLGVYEPCTPGVISLQSVRWTDCTFG